MSHDTRPREVNRALRFTLLGVAVIVLTNVLLELNRSHYGRFVGLCLIAFCIWFYSTEIEAHWARKLNRALRFTLLGLVLIGAFVLSRRRRGRWPRPPLGFGARRRSPSTA